MFAKNAQHVADLNIISHRIAELSLTPGAIAQDGFLTTHLIESLNVPERDLIKEYLGRPDDIISTPTPAQRMIYGETRRRIPELWDVDNPVMAGIVQNQDAYMQSVAAQRPFFFDHIQSLTDQAFDEFYQLTGRKYGRVMSYRAEDADYLIIGQGSVVPSTEAVCLMPSTWKFGPERSAGYLPGDYVAGVWVDSGRHTCPYRPVRADGLGGQRWQATQIGFMAPVAEREAVGP